LPADIVLSLPKEVFVSDETALALVGQMRHQVHNGLAAAEVEERGMGSPDLFDDRRHLFFWFFFWFLIRDRPVVAQQSSKRLVVFYIKKMKN
jgi:hypothetical protein